MKTFSLAISLFTLNLALADTAAYVHIKSPIYGFSVDRKGLTLQVESGGCTSKDDFDLRIQETYPMGIIIERVNQDLCEAYLPYGTKILFTYEDLGLLDGDVFEINAQYIKPIEVIK